MGAEGDPAVSGAGSGVRGELCLRGRLRQHGLLPGGPEQPHPSAGLSQGAAHLQLLLYISSPPDRKHGDAAGPEKCPADGQDGGDLQEIHPRPDSGLALPAGPAPGQPEVHLIHGAAGAGGLPLRGPQRPDQGAGADAGGRAGSGK